MMDSKLVRKKIVHIINAVTSRFAKHWNWPLFGSVFLVCLLATPLTGCAWLDNKQRSITYRPTPGVPADFAGLRQGDQRYFLPVPSPCNTQAPCETASKANAVAQTQLQQIEVWWLPHPDANAPTLLYLHGTFRNLYQNLHKIDALRAAGFALLAVDYRGWGQSTAMTPSEVTIMQDARLAFAEFQRLETRPAYRFIYGHSMGTGVAVDLASGLQAKADYGGLILESAFTSFSDIARQVGFVGYLASLFNTERFESINKISKVNAPLLMLHGGLDTTVPMVLGKQLFDAANEPKQWVPIANGTHSNLNLEAPAQYQETVMGFRVQVTAR